jgi:hypothetical protein
MGGGGEEEEEEESVGVFFQLRFIKETFPIADATWFQFLGHIPLSLHPPRQ